MAKRKRTKGQTNDPQNTT